MENTILEYRVRSGDTLKSISSRLGMTDEELKLFHNSHCPKTDIIRLKSLTGIRRILVPAVFKSEKQQREERKNRLPSSLLLDSFYASSYKVSENIESLYEPNISISYTVDLNLNKDHYKNQLILSYVQKDFKSDEQIVEDKVSSLSIASMNSIMPLCFIIHDQGNITGLADHKKLMTAFTERRQQIEDFFTGEIAEIYMNSFERSIIDEIFVLQQFQSTLLFQSLFPELNRFHQTKAWKETFYFYKNSFPVQCEMNIEQEISDDRLVKTTLNGSLAEPYSLQEIIRGIRLPELPAEPASGNILLEYTTHQQSKNLLQLKASVSLREGKDLIHRHTITLIQE
ncbi:MAG: hypothetical protein LBE92_18985 [Chryseobacterium sp.]|jgi:hypothetical protein|uniref:hypothetical protein n=1 Tax=Chryseobacterium sp. TaxID=1871047 RepID=UPI0028295704|nr:hypothetical protein [Chryseobacterium sp.]MDR2238215.1 hypothetical protein [Chryseobacterium sp.]